jgi:hypothetical protein
VIEKLNEQIQVKQSQLKNNLQNFYFSRIWISSLKLIKMNLIYSKASLKNSIKPLNIIAKPPNNMSNY